MLLLFFSVKTSEICGFGLLPRYACQYFHPWKSQTHLPSHCFRASTPDREPSQLSTWQRGAKKAPSLQTGGPEKTNKNTLGFAHPFLSAESTNQMSLILPWGSLRGQEYYAPTRSSHGNLRNEAHVLPPNVVISGVH